MEGALIQHGQASTPGEGALTRLSLPDRQGRILVQYAYRLEPVLPAGRPGGYGENGIAEILAVGPRRLPVIERAGRQTAHDFTFDARLYHVDLQDATALDPDVPIAAGVRPAVKRQLLGDAQLPVGWSANCEAMAWGPRLANGHRSLVIVSDNNVRDGPSRFLVFDADADSAWR